MKLKIHHPRTLLVLLMMIGALTASALLLADPDGSSPVRSVEIPAFPLKPPTPEQEQDALDIARKSGLVEGINGGQGWTAEHIFWTAVAGTQAISFEAKWEEPVDHEGPWSLIKCKGTRKLVSPIEWSGVTRVEVIVDINNRTVTGLAVTAEPDEDAPVMGSGHLGSVARLYDVESGDIVFEGRGSDLPLPEDFCPVGTHYQG